MQNEHWETEKLGKYATVQGGFAYPSKAFDKSGVPVLKIQNIRLRDVTTNEVSYVSSELAEETSRFYVQNGDVLISMTGSWSHQPNSVVGRVARFTGKSNTFLINQRVGRFIIKEPKKLDLHYLFFILCDSDYQNSLVLGASGSANQANISGKQIELIQIPVPPIEEQKAIAKILSSLDDKIALNRQMNQTLEAMARALFNAWFVDFEPVRANSENRPSESASPEIAKLFPSEFENGIPKDWRNGTIGENYKLTMGQSPSGETYNEVGEGIIFFQGRTDFGFRYPSPRIYCTEPTRFAEKGDSLVSVRAPVGDVNMAFERSCIGRGVAALRHNSESRSFTYYSVKNLEEKLKKFDSEGTVFGSINKNSFRAIETIAPTVNIVELFENTVGNFDSRIEINSKEIFYLTQIRDSLLPRLISGKIRVSEAENEIAQSV